MTFLKLKSMDLTSYAKNFLSYSVDKHKIYFHRFTDNQLNIYKKDVLFEAMSLSAAGVYIEFVTNANKLTIKVKKSHHETCFNWFEKYGFTNNTKGCY